MNTTTLSKGGKKSRKFSMPQPTPLRNYKSQSNKSRSNKTSHGFLKKMKLEHDTTPRGSKPFSFIAPLYASIPNLGDGGPISCKEFPKCYNFSSISLSLNWIRICRDIIWRIFTNILDLCITKMGKVMFLMKIQRL
jgi:hypothetical protein